MKISNARRQVKLPCTLAVFHFHADPLARFGRQTDRQSFCEDHFRASRGTLLHTFHASLSGTGAPNYLTGLPLKANFNQKAQKLTD